MQEARLKRRLRPAEPAELRLRSGPYSDGSCPVEANAFRGVGRPATAPTSTSAGLEQSRRAAAAGACDDRAIMTSAYLAPVQTWYSEHARDLPWRAPTASAWSVLVSEVMLQQTPVSRVLPAYRTWLERWPEPAALAAATAADAVRQWDRLGYPRRAVRLHASSQLIVSRYGGEVPASADELRQLPGIGSYTAAAVASFAFGRRHAVLDVNVRRVLARLVTGQALPRPAQSAAEVALAESLLPADGREAARWSVGVMELGALVCTAREPSCRACPLSGQCAWLQLGRPAGAPGRKAPGYLGSDRQCRGALMAVLRDAHRPVPADVLAACWDDSGQRARSLAALIADGLVIRCANGALALPGESG
jgi:A/G-specific adenine glycosylase